MYTESSYTLYYLKDLNPICDVSLLVITRTPHCAAAPRTPHCADPHSFFIFHRTPHYFRTSKKGKKYGKQHIFFQGDTNFSLKFL